MLNFYFHYEFYRLYNFVFILWRNCCLTKLYYNKHFNIKFLDVYYECVRALNKLKASRATLSSKMMLFIIIGIGYSLMSVTWNYYELFWCNY